MGGGKLRPHKKIGKILSQLLCISAVFTACTDDEVVNQVDKAPLQVSVNTSLAKQSRSIVHGEWLLAGSTIGVSVFDTKGADYDGQGYYNIQYKATGEEEDQVWSSMGVTPAVSANEAMLLAYHPYNDDEDLDIFAMPVEIASQTDYMYSGPVTGITNAAPKADIVLNHALTAIRVKLVLGDFTGDVAVSEIAVASPALASSATLNAVDGSLDNITGQGDKFTLPVDFNLVTGGTDNDIMFVPDAAVESGVTTVSATIGGKKYTAGIEFDEAYKQGYIYTYTLTLNNSGFAVTKVNVNPWETGTSKDGELKPYKDIEINKTQHSASKKGEQIEFIITAENPWIASADQDWCTLNITSGDAGVTTVLATVDENMLEQARFATVTVTTDYYSVPVVIYQQSELDDEYIVKVLIAEDNMPYQHNVTGFIGTIDWGDGTTDTYAETTTFPSHTYTNADTYTVTAKGIANTISIIEGDLISGNITSMVETPYIKELISIGSDMGINSMQAAFTMNQMLDVIYPNAIKGLKVQDFSMAFGMTKLSSVPEGLFDNCPEVTSFESTFEGCANLTNVPVRLFDKCPEVSSFQRTFSGCIGLVEIPIGLFHNNIKVNNFTEVFNECTSLQDIPANTFSTEVVSVSFSNAFYNSGITIVKSNAFNCPNITSLANVFSKATSLTTLEEYAFNCPKVSNYDGMFYNTGITYLPANTFITEATDVTFNNTFAGCNALATVKSNAFNCPNITNLANMFKNVTSLTTLEEYAFNCTKVTNYDGMFYNTGITHLPANTFITEATDVTFDNTFAKCNALATVKSNAFNCPNLTSLANVFKNVASLTTLEENAFNCPEVTSFAGTFWNCIKLTKISEGLFDKCTKVKEFSDVFRNCKNLQVIPERLFNKCSEVSSFAWAFSSCSALTSIPEGLFDSCTEVTDFTGTFNYCSKLQAIPMGLFDYNTIATTFYNTFTGCTSLTSIPQGLFDKCTEVTNFENTFYGCNALQTIPEGLFDKCTEVTNFYGTFSTCTSLKTIPVGLFDKCTEVINFSCTFYKCVNLQAISQNLFEGCAKVTNFSYAFYGCSSLQAIPEGLFDNCPGVTNFEYTFMKCSNLQEIPEGLFDKCTEVTSFNETFNRCTSLTEIPEGLFENSAKVGNFTRTFSECSSLTELPRDLFKGCGKVISFIQTFNNCSNLQTISQGLFEGCTEVTSFKSTFEGCESLTSIPEGLFDNNTKVTTFYNAFNSCINLQTIPEGLFDKCTKVGDFTGTFNYCSKLQAIPEGLFDKCTEVKDFANTFYDCKSLISIPGGLFDKCTEVTNFANAFYNCRNLTGESPYTIINVDGVDTKVHLYERVNYPEYFTKPTSYVGCFDYCSKLTDYNSIPSSWL